MDAEFDDAAATTAEVVADADLDERIVAACRGSANPASLAWLAEGCGLGPATSVVDLGSGLGGPAAWLSRRYRCPVVAVEPARGAAAGASALFDVPVVRGDAARAPLRSASAHTALLLGVVSVAGDPLAVLAEAARVATHVAVLDEVATEGPALHAGGSTFPSAGQLRGWCAEVGLTIDVSVDQPLPAPPRWRHLADRAAEATDARRSPGLAPTLDAAARSEAEVIAAIESGQLVAHLLLARARS